MKRSTVFPAFVAVLLVAGAAAAGTVKGAYIGCITEDALNEFITAVANDDLRQGQALMRANQCFAIEGREFSVVERGFAKSRIRVYAGGGSVLLWTVTEATR